MVAIVSGVPSTDLGVRRPGCFRGYVGLNLVLEEASFITRGRVGTVHNGGWANASDGAMIKIETSYGQVPDDR